VTSKKWFIIDGNSLINRTFYALPPLTNSKGLHTNAIYGFASILMKVIDEERPDYIGVAFDKKAPTFRHKDYKDYKAGRLKMPEELAQQIPLLVEMLTAFGIEKISLEGYEADDLIGTLSKYGEQQGMQVKILTGDRDAFQLASDLTTVWYTKKGISELDKIDRQEVFNRYGVTPNELIDVKGLMGDKSDNIPGVPGVGEKTALKLIQEYKTIEGVYNNIDDIKKKALNNNLNTYREQAVLSKKLATIIRDIPLVLNIEDYRLEDPYNEKVADFFNELEFYSLLERIGLEKNVNKEINYKKELDYRIIKNNKELKDLINKIDKNGSVYISWLLGGNNHIRKKLQGLAIGIGEELFFINLEKIDEQKTLQEMKRIFENHEIRKIGHNMKELMVFLLINGIKLRGLEFDTYIAAYILEPSDAKYDLHLLASKYLNQQIISEEQLLGKGKKARLYIDLGFDEKSSFLIRNLDIIINLYEKLQNKIEEHDMKALYYEIELPLIDVLANMENTGFRVEKEELINLSKEFGDRIQNLTKEIYELAGEEFNINSPKQLGHILFEILKLPIIKKTKTGYSTNIEVLERLKDKHPIIDKIIEIRQITKLKSTYVDGLMNIIDDETHNIHSSFNQTIASTGRISSSEPNLQNIPIKMEMGRRIRRVFVPQNPENYLVDADYSQIELRILAHISGDKSLIEAFNKGQDIHTQTASQVFDVDINDVTPIMRSRAKAVNFGIVYGISDFGLSRDLNIPRHEAKQYIDNYKDKYFGVRNYMKEIVVKAKEQGYVTTIFGRKRYIPELQSRNFNIRSFGERLALNTPIQGTAADIIKIAMINVYRRLAEQKMHSKLILQVHDELIVEALEDELEQVKSIMVTEMEKAAKLAVELKVDISYGKSWYDTK
jgi:DNA polymerase-1